VHLRLLHQRLDSRCLRACRVKEVGSFFVGRAYDATPMLVYFGSLAVAVSPHARYFVKAESSTPGRLKWKSLSLEEFVATRGPSANRPAKGSLELFAQTADVAWITKDGSTYSGTVICQAAVGVMSRLYEFLLLLVIVGNCW
jgi:hypothetical protein